MPASIKSKSKKRKITAEDLFGLKVPVQLAISPCEQKIIYTLERMDQKENKYFTNLFMLDLKSGSHAQFTHGDVNDSQPVWSPDGSQIAFVSGRNKKTGIYLINSAGGSEQQIFEVEGSVSSLQWTPDQKSLVFNLRYNDSHFIKDEKKKKEPPVYRHITRLFYKLDGLGFIPQDTFQVYSLEIGSKKLNKITKHKRDNLAPVLSPDGKSIAYLSNRAKDPDVDIMKGDIFVIPFKGGKERKIKTPEGPKSSLTFSPDGKTLGYIGHDNPNDEWGVTNQHVWTVGVSGRQKAKDLIPKFDRHAHDDSIADFSDFHDTAVLYWSGDGKRLYFLSSDTGNTNLFYITRGGGKPTRIFRGDCHVRGVSVNGKTKTAALIHADINNLGEIVTCPTQYEGEKSAEWHSDFNPQLKKEIKLSRTRHLMFKSFDGTQVQGWLVTPPNFNPNRKYPAILNIHGGPRVQYAHTFFHEMQYLAAQGYVVFYTNPRGGAGRGETWAEAIAGGWGGLDYKDCMAAADYMEKLPYVNSKRIGVTGGSYGGYMTNWLIGHTNRFAAAVTQRSVVDLASFYGSSDIGWAFEREYRGKPWEIKEHYEKSSPITYYKNIKCPVLIIHSEQDLRCNIEQAEQMFVRLKRMGKKVEMVRFPEEPHGLSRHGRPDRRIARLNWIKKWFDKYLK